MKLDTRSLILLKEEKPLLERNEDTPGDKLTLLSSYLLC